MAPFPSAAQSPAAIDSHEIVVRKVDVSLAELFGADEKLIIRLQIHRVRAKPQLQRRTAVLGLDNMPDVVHIDLTRYELHIRFRHVELNAISPADASCSMCRRLASWQLEIVVGRLHDRACFCARAFDHKRARLK